MIEMDFDATQRSVAEVIRAGDHIIPRYQRDYAWEEENIRDLWNDLRRSRDDGHFLGNMVVHASGREQWDLVDGQQRLTTILIALRSLKDAYEGINASGRAEGISEFIQQKNLDGDVTFRLMPRNGAGYLQSHILSDEADRILEREPKSDAERAQKGAFELLSKLISDEIATSSLDVISATDAIRDRFLQANVIYVRAGDKKNAFRVFETLNDRGKSLRQIDLVKNQVISAIPANAPREEERIWDDSIHLIESTSWTKVDSEDFLGYFWNSTSLQSDDEIVAVNRIRRSVDSSLELSASEEEGARHFIRILYQTAEIFKEFDACLASPNGKHWQSVVPSHRWRKDKFQEIDAALYGCLVPGSNLPLNALFSLLRSYIHPESRAIPKDTLIEFLQSIEFLQFRWSISKRPSTSTIRRTYRRASYAVDAAKNAGEYRTALESFKRDAQRIMPTDSQFKEGLKGLTYFNHKPADVHRLRHTLERIEAFWGSSKLPRDQDMTLEHIAPQGGRSKDSRRNFWLGKLGNLALLPVKVNSDLPPEFTDKAPIIADWINDSDLVLHRQIIADKWDNATANERMDELLEIAVQVWPKSY